MPNIAGSDMYRKAKHCTNHDQFGGSSSQAQYRIKLLVRLILRAGLVHMSRSAATGTCTVEMSSSYNQALLISMAGQ